MMHVISIAWKSIPLNLSMWWYPRTNKVEVIEDFEVPLNIGGQKFETLSTKI